MLIRWARKRFPDGSLIKTSTRESYSYAEPDGHVVEVRIYFAGKEAHPKNLIDSRDLVKWDFPREELISDSKRAEIIHKFEQYFGAGNIGVEETAC